MDRDQPEAEAAVLDPRKPGSLNDSGQFVRRRERGDRVGQVCIGIGIPRDDPSEETGADPEGAIEEASQVVIAA